eukprot:2340254-Prymnesium_polylepis.2
MIDSTCHNSAKDCVGCGMPLYCDTPPPIVAIQKECVGASRVGVGCQDSISMGVCMDEGMEDCHEACKRTASCNVFVLYTKERRGSCVLCSDLEHYEESTIATTRAYQADKACATASAPEKAGAKPGYSTLGVGVDKSVNSTTITLAFAHSKVRLWPGADACAGATVVASSSAYFDDATSTCAPRRPCACGACACS